MRSSDWLVIITNEPKLVIVSILKRIFKHFTIIPAVKRNNYRNNEVSMGLQGAHIR